VSVATPAAPRQRAVAQRPRRSGNPPRSSVSATYLLLAIKTVGVENVAPLAAGTDFRRECEVEADRARGRAAVAAAWEQLSRVQVATVRTLLAGLGVIVVTPRHPSR
jgi:hypothetical protein